MEFSHQELSFEVLFAYVSFRCHYYAIKLINQGDAGMGKFGTRRNLKLHPQLKSFMPKNQFRQATSTGEQVRPYYEGIAHF